METKQKRIQELEQEFEKELSEFGATYIVNSETTQGNKKINVKHMSVVFPAKVKVNVKEVVSLVEKYYGKVFAVSRVKNFTLGCSFSLTESSNRQELVLNLESGWKTN